MKKTLMLILFCLAMISFASCSSSSSRTIFDIARDGTPKELKAKLVSQDKSIER